MESKVCSKCGIPKGTFEFHKKRNGKFGVSSICKTCRKFYRRSLYIKNKHRLNKMLEIQRDKLEDPYIKKLIRQKTGLKQKEIEKYPELIQNQRLILELKRETKNL